MPIDPQIRMLLELGAALPPLHTLTVAEARAQFAARDFPGLRTPEIARAIDRDMQGPGGPLGLRIYTPLGLGPFPLMNYWGPMAGLRSTQWIVAASAKVWQASAPELQLTYLPHLDYDLQRFGPRSAQAAKAVVELSEAVEPLLLAAGKDRVVVLSGRPGRVVKELVVPFERPRHPDVMRSPLFHELADELTLMLEPA